MKRKPLPRMASVTTLERLALHGEHGRYWYDYATSEIAAAADMIGCDARRFADLLALFSPRVNVKRNIKLTLAYLRSGDKPDGCMASVMASVHHYERTGEIRGPKTAAFARACSGDGSAIVLDTWMANAFGVGQVQFSRKSVHRECCKRIRMVAKRLGWRPAEVQAAIWTAVATLSPGETRRNGNDKRYRNAPQLSIIEQIGFWDVNPIDDGESVWGIPY